MRLVWNNVTMAAIVPSASDLMQSVAEDAEYEEVSETSEERVITSKD